ncbi:hypothetical protein BJG92_03154 [Arthrobacter sp. SO5]|uniref:GOLPH3/VPS74 family protein n=1 Tax=Arthrobacter sp. SO5 TaxID=1897055 RepID=UPI001E5A0D26|nr:GPP34 family phosphoprotein [Arthrobacter sp. SO5]MCB5275603.1 hypothetical protein [Arthrobacter sp. SO5]
MNAETPTAAELNLPQAFLLLATNDQDGTPEVPMFVLRTTLAGAILAELELIGAIGLEGKNVRATGTAPRVYEGMASRGIVEHVGEKHLGLFKSTRYPEKDHGPEAALLKEIRAAVGGPPSESGASDAAPTGAGTADVGASDAGTPAPAKPEAKAPDARTTALIALLQAAGLLGKLVPAADKIRASELAKDYWPSRAVEDELRMIRLAEEEEPGISGRKGSPQ